MLKPSGYTDKPSRVTGDTYSSTIGFMGLLMDTRHVCTVLLLYLAASLSV